jgi:hypothetical protein
MPSLRHPFLYVIWNVGVVTSGAGGVAGANGTAGSWVAGEEEVAGLVSAVGIKVVAGVLPEAVGGGAIS